VQDCLRHCHELIEATVRDSVNCSDEASPSSASGSDNHNNDDDDDDEGRQSGAVHQPSTPTDVRDISLVSAGERPSTGLL